MIHDKRICAIMHLSAGGLVALTAILGDHMLGNSPDWGLLQTLTLAAGSLIIALGFLPYMGIVHRVSTNLCLSLLSVFMLLAVCEVFFRAIAFDFANERKAWQKTPPYYRQPIVPTGEVFFRHAGPEEWTGQVLNTRLSQLHILPNPYTNEPVITVKYNKEGFRNPDDISDWNVVVTGDSFTELGYLRDEELFTTILGEILKVGVLNLGTSYTGPLTQLSYLRDYGISGSTQHAIIGFFEGNDLEDLVTEYKALIHWQESGQRDYREFKSQPSLVRAVYKLLENPVRRIIKPTHYVNAYFKSLQGDIPVTLACTPPGSSNISEDTLNYLKYFLNEYARFGMERRVTVWLAYMPTKRRVLHGQIEFSDSTPEMFRNWQPTDLPELVSELCDQYGVKFIDLTPALIKETQNKAHLVYNSIYDTHLNWIGSRVVARELARHLATQSQWSPNGMLSSVHKHGL